MQNKYNIESNKINNPFAVRIEGSNGGQFQKMEHFIVKDEDGNILLETKEFSKTQDTTYFLRESCKKDAFLMGVCELMNGLRASGYAYNETHVIKGITWYRMSAYIYRYTPQTHEIVRTTWDKGAASGRSDKEEPVAKVSGRVITMLKKKPKTGKKVNNPEAQRTDTNKVHGTDYSARGALEKKRRDNKRK